MIIPTLYSMTKDRKVLDTKTITFGELKTINEELYLSNGFGQIPVVNFGEKYFPRTLNSSNKDEIINFLSTFYCDDAPITIKTYDCDRTPTGRECKKYGSIKSFKTITFENDPSTKKINTSLREIIEVTKSENNDYMSLYHHLMDTYGERYIQMYSSDFSVSMCTWDKWFNNNMVRYFEKEPDGTILNFSVSMVYDNPILRGKAKYIDFSLMSSECEYLKTYNRIKESRDRAICDYYDSKSSGGYCGD